MTQDPKQATGTEGDEIRLGKSLFDDVSGYISRGEQVPDKLYDAMKEWQGNAAVMAHQQDPDRARAWYDAFTSMDRGLTDAVARRQKLEQNELGDFVGVNTSGPSPVVQPLGYQVPALPSSMDARQYAVTPEARRRASILGAPIEMKDGHALVTDSEGETWDLTDALATLNQPDVRAHLRESLMGVMPMPAALGGGTVAHTFGAMPMVQAVARGMGRFDVATGGDPSTARVDNIQTASPGLVLPWAIQGVDSAKFQDPVWTRALMQTLGTIDAKPTGWETFAHATAMAADFALFAKGAGALGEAGASTLAKILPADTLPSYLAKTAAKGAAGGGYVWPMNSDVLKTALSFMGYEAATKSTDDQTTLSQDLWNGLQQGVVFGVAGKAAQAMRGAVGAIPMVGTALERIMPRIASAGPVGKLVDSEEALARIQKFAEPTFEATIGKEALAPYAKEALQRGLDAFTMGTMVSAYGQAQQAKPGEGFRTFWRSLFTPQAAATGLAFAINGALQYAYGIRPQVNAALKSEAGQAYQRSMAEALASPNAEPHVRDMFELFDRWREKDPDTFAGIVKMNPAAQQSYERTAAEDQRLRNAMQEGAETHLMDLVGAPGRESTTAETTKVETPETTRPPDALAAFKEMTADADRELEQGGKTVQHPTYTLGEIPAEHLAMLGFDATTDSGKFKHAVNAVNEYLREVEGNTKEKYARLSDVPQALFRRMLDWRDNDKQPQGQLTLEDAAQQLKAVEAEPAYKGLAPLEQVAVAQAKQAARRPSLDSAIKQVLTGKKDAAWLRQTFPEGARHVGDTAAADWIGKFERGVRDAWKARATTQLAKINRERQTYPSLRSFAAKVGGLRFTEDLESLTSKELGRGGSPVVRSRGSSGGADLDTFGESAWQAGYFATRPTEREIIDALNDDLRHPADVRGSAANVPRPLDYMDVLHARELNARRDAIESGSAPMPPRDELLDLFAGDPRYAGLPLDQVEKEVTQLRAQAKVGDPGAMLAGPPETTADHAYRAAQITRRVTENLKALGLLDPEATPQSEEASGAVLNLISGEKPEDMAQSTWDDLRNDAIDARAATRDTLRAVLRDTKQEQRLDAHEDVWDYLDARAEGRDVPSDVRERLKAARWIDDNDDIYDGLIEGMQREAADAVWDQIKKREATGDPGFASFVPPLAFTGRKFTSVEETRWGRLFTWTHWLDKPSVQRWLQNNPWAQKVGRAFAAAGSVPGINVVNTGPISRPQTSEMKAINELWLFRQALIEGKTRDRELAALLIQSKLFRAFGGKIPPRSHLLFWDRGVETKAFRDAKGPEDFEKMRKGTAYLWPIWVKSRDLLEEMGGNFVKLGWMTQKQLDELGGGAYLGHYYVREQLDSEARELGEGNWPVRYLGRMMSRGDGEPGAADVAFRIQNPLVTFSGTVHDEAQLLRVAEALKMTMDGQEFWRTGGQVSQLNPSDRDDYQRAAIRAEPVGSEGPLDAIRRLRGKEPPEALTLGRRLVTLEAKMAKPDEKPAKGQMRYSKQLHQMIRFFLGEGPDGPIYLPKTVAQQLDISMSEMFTLPGENAMAKIGSKLDLMTAFVKRGFVVMRPAAWLMNMGGNTYSNAMLGGVPLNDFVRGAAGLPSDTADGTKGLGLLMRWYEQGQPKAKPDGWTDDDWIRSQQARHFNAIAGPSSSVFATLSPAIARDLGQAVFGSDDVKAGLMRQMQELADKYGWDDTQRTRLEAAIVQKSGRLMRGLEPIDKAIAKLMGEADPAGHARAMATYAAAWHLTELFTSKYPAYLRARREWPDAPAPQVLSYALGKTQDMRDTSAGQRRFLSLHTPYNDKVWQAANPNAKAKMIASQVFRGRFWSFSATMVPKFIRGHLTNPVGMAAASAGLMGLGNLLNQYLLKDDDERRRWEEEMAVSKQSATRWLAQSQADEEAIKNLGDSMRISMFGPSVKLPAVAVDAAAALWKRVRYSDPFVFAMPKHGGESRSGSLAQLTPTGYLLDRARGLAQLGEAAYGAVTGTGDARENARKVVQGVDRLYGIQAQAAASLIMGVATGDEPIIQALGGKGSMTEALGRGLFAVAGSAGAMYPTLGLATPEGQYLGESVVLHGQKWNEWARGYQRAYIPDRPEDALLGTALRYSWPVRSLFQREPLGTPMDGWTAVLSEMYGPGFDPSNADGRMKVRAHAWVAGQMSSMIADLYEKHFDEQGEPGKGEVPLDERVAGALRETFENTQPSGLGEWSIAPGYQPKGFLLQAIAAQPEYERSAIIDDLRRYASRDAFQENGMNMLWAAGRRAELPKALFREGFRNAMDDTTGQGLIHWWRSQIDAHPDNLGYLAPLRYDVETPEEGSGAFNDYVHILAAYNKANIPLPPQIDSVQKSVDDILGEQGDARLLQGAKSFRTVIHQRSESPLMDLLKGRRQ